MLQSIPMLQDGRSFLGSATFLHMLSNENLAWLCSSPVSRSPVGLTDFTLRGG